MTSTPVRTTQPLSAAMRDGSAAEHRDAEGSTFMARMLDGQVDREAYLSYLTRLHAVYDALERVGRTLTADPSAAAVVDSALFRLDALAADITFWGGPVRIDSPAADAYVARIEAATSTPHRYLAHHYTRYLGDLSGGQAIGRVISRTFELPEGLGVQFYRFAQIPKPKPYKDAYRARLDALSLSAADHTDVVNEVKVAFGLNQSLFDELGQEHPAS